MRRPALPSVIGHRGIAASAPENTLAGFARAAELGVAWVELDVQLTADGVPVVFHDDGLERTAGGSGRLVDTRFEALRRLDAGAWFGASFAGQAIPTLEEALATIGDAGLGLVLEIKADDARGPLTAQVSLATARRVWPAHLPPPLVSSFSRRAMAAAQEAAPDWPRGFLFVDRPADWRDAARDFGCVSLHGQADRFDAAQVTEMRQAGYAVLAYTVNDGDEARRLWGWGVDSVFSDCPEMLPQARG
jgi:glycerophosphoryl diester phosphodiesterase